MEFNGNMKSHIWRGAVMLAVGAIGWGVGQVIALPSGLTDIHGQIELVRTEGRATADAVRDLGGWLKEDRRRTDERLSRLERWIDRRTHRPEVPPI
jgi:hypothetical protein